MDPAPHPTSLPLEVGPHDGLGQHVRSRLLGLGRTRDVQTGRPLPPGPEGGQALQLVLAGAMIVRLVSVSGRQAVIDLLFPGEVFDGQHGSAGPAVELAALVPSRVLSIEAGLIEEVLGRDGDVAAWLAGRKADRVRHYESRLASVLLYAVPERVERTLQALAERSPGGTYCVGIPLTQEILAQMVGATRESVNRAISALVRAGRIRRTGLFYRVVPSRSLR